MICTFNVNGIRQIRDKKGGNLTPLFSELHMPSILCLQECKILERHLDYSIGVVNGYDGYFALCGNNANTSRRRTPVGGYSGCATFVKKEIVTVDAVNGICRVPNSITINGNHDGNGGRRNSLKLPSEFYGLCRDLLGLEERRVKEIDGEGRCVITDHRQFVLFNVYIPCISKDPIETIAISSSSSAAAAAAAAAADEDEDEDAEEEEEEAMGKDRVKFKYDFLRVLKLRMDLLRKEGRRIVLVGDLNLRADALMDSAFVTANEDANEDQVKNNEVSAEISAERNEIMKELELQFAYINNWLPNLLSAEMIDSFRHLHPTRKDAYSCWSTLKNCRTTNYGSRIDYILIDKELQSLLVESDLMSDVQGSDHCPVYCKLSRILQYKNGNADDDDDDDDDDDNDVTLKKLILPLCYRSTQSNIHSFLVSGDKRSPPSFLEDDDGNSSKNNNNNNNNKKKIKPALQQQMSLSQLWGNANNSSKSNSNSNNDNNSNSNNNNKKKVTISEFNTNQTFASNEIFKNQFVERLFIGVPQCEHKEDCVTRKVLKDGPNKGKTFYCCKRGLGDYPRNPEARCNFFMFESEWKKKRKV